MGLTGNVAYYLYEEMNRPEYAVKTINLNSSEEQITMTIETPEIERDHK